MYEAEALEKKRISPLGMEREGVEVLLLRGLGGEIEGEVAATITSIGGLHPWAEKGKIIPSLSHICFINCENNSYR